MKPHFCHQFEVKEGSIDGLNRMASNHSQELEFKSNQSMDDLRLLEEKIIQNIKMLRNGSQNLYQKMIQY